MGTRQIWASWLFEGVDVFPVKRPGYVRSLHQFCFGVDDIKGAPSGKFHLCIARLGGSKLLVCSGVGLFSFSGQNVGFVYTWNFLHFEWNCIDELG